MTTRRPSRLVPVFLTAFVLLAATPGLATPTSDRPAASPVLQLFQELWAQLTGSFASLFTAAGEEAASGGTLGSDPTRRAATDEPVAQPQHGPDYDPNG